MRTLSKYNCIKREWVYDHRYHNRKVFLTVFIYIKLVHVNILSFWPNRCATQYLIFSNNQNVIEPQQPLNINIKKFPNSLSLTIVNNKITYTSTTKSKTHYLELNYPINNYRKIWWVCCHPFVFFILAKERQASTYNKIIVMSNM